MDKSEIKEIRLALGLSQRRLANKLGVSKLSVYKWEAGRSVPHPVFVKMITELRDEKS